MGPDIDEEIKQFMPETLYHYTSKTSLLGILNGKCLWCTNIFYLNDSTEFNHAKEMTIEELDRHIPRINPYRPRVPEPSALDIAKEMVFKKTRSAIENAETDNIFIFSLTQKWDDLNQWRAYCPGGNGFSIGFDTKKLDELLPTQRFNPDYRVREKCVYDAKKQQDAIKLFINADRDLLEIARLEDSAEQEKKLHWLSGIFAATLLSSAPIMKDPKFFEEEEWRIIYQPVNPDIKFRPGTSMIVPYVEIPLTDLTHAIKEIWVGPTPHMNLSVKSIRALMKKHNIDCEVIPSEVPFISW